MSWITEFIVVLLAIVMFIDCLEITYSRYKSRNSWHKKPFSFKIEKKKIDKD